MEPVANASPAGLVPALSKMGNLSFLTGSRSILARRFGPVTGISSTKGRTSCGIGGRPSHLDFMPMGPVSAEIEIDAPREQVYAALLDLSRRPSFTDHFLAGFNLTRIDPVGVGAGARFCVEGPVRNIWMDTTIVATE